MKRTITIFLLTTIILTSCGPKIDIEGSQTPPKYVTTQIVEKKSFFEQLKLPGKIFPLKETHVSSLSS
jgi:hypothetical protein